MREMNTLTTKAMYNSCYGNSVLITNSEPRVFCYGDGDNCCNNCLWLLYAITLFSTFPFHLFAQPYLLFARSLSHSPLYICFSPI